MVTIPRYVVEVLQVLVHLAIYQQEDAQMSQTLGLARHQFWSLILRKIQRMWRDEWNLQNHFHCCFPTHKEELVHQRQHVLI